MVRLLHRVVVVLMAGVFLVVLPVMVAASNDLNVMAPFSGTEPNPCNGEDVLFSGQMHVVIHTTVSASGNIHFDSLDNYADVKGIGLATSTPYTITDSTHEDLNLNGPAMNATVTEQHIVNSHGPATNFFLHDVLHITVDATGMPSASVDNIRTGCSG